MQNALDEVLAEEKIDKSVATVVTQVVVDKNDSAFTNPTKPIGPFHIDDEVERLRRQNSSFTFVEDAGRGFRRVVPSPRPIDVKESDIINVMVKNGIIPISVGGGGVPVVEENHRLVGKEAVIDKDFASEKLAELVDADLLIILTAVDNIFINFNTPDQKKLTDTNVEELKSYIKENQFAKGSMLPKVEATINFVEKTGKKAVVTSLENINNFIQRGEGTIISKI